MKENMNNNGIGVHHGAREINVDFLKQSIPGLDDLDNTTCKILPLSSTLI